MNGRRRSIAPILLLGLLGVVGIAAGAEAAVPVVAAPNGQQAGYATPRVVQLEGSPLTFVNADPIAPHDVVATAVDRNDRPLFRSALAQAGQAVPVTGAERLAPGDYRFVCSLHGLMVGTLTVLADLT